MIVTSKIRATNIHKSYNDIPILKGLSIEIPHGKITVILGRSGCGKSVLLRQLVGLEDPDSGTIEIDGISLTSLSKEEKKPFLHQIGMLFQNSALFDSMTIQDNVMFPLIYMKKERYTPSLEKAKTAISKVGLSGYELKYPSELSGGQKRRAALARLIVYTPSIFLFDEPTTGLDPVTSKQISELIQTTQRELSATAVLVTHDIISALAIGEHFAFHHDGGILFSGSRDEFFKNKDPLLASFLENFRH